MRFVFVLAVVLATAAPPAAQYVPRDERGSLGARARTDLDGNDALASSYNFGQAGRTSGTPTETPFEWPAGTRQRYLALTGLFVGAEVEGATGEPAFIVNVPNYRSNVSNPGQAWTWIPVPEYAAAGEIARSDRPETWPAVWPDKLGDADDPGWAGSWNGIRGKDAFLDGVETYTHYTDDQYDRNRRSAATTYLPDPADPERAGLGVVVSERRIAARDASVEDALFAVRDLFNVGTQELTGVSATLWVADLVGGDADASDDREVFLADRRMVVFADADGMSPDPAFPAGQTVGAAALVLLEAPEALGFTRVRHLPAGSISFQSASDAFLYDELMVPGDYVPPAPSAQDRDTFASVGLFGIPAGGSVRLATAVVFGAVDYTSDDPEVRFAEVLERAEAARAFYAGGFVTAGEPVAGAAATALQIAPNPSAGAFRVTVSLAEAQAVRVEVLDPLGRVVARLADGALGAGAHVLAWDGRRAGVPVASGVYLVRLTTARGVETRAVTVAR